NQWAISVPRTMQTASETIAQKAIAYGIEGVLVDGNDIFGVYKIVKDAIEKARSGKGPTLIECYTYRLQNHTTADDWKKYRSEEEVAEWKRKDPIERLKKYMESEGLWNSAYEQMTLEDAKGQVSEAVAKFESATQMPPTVMFDNVYAELPPEIEEQRKDFE
ncbi:MAG: pyruvate dehydrogenase (acetyl-transferring) E1 component subunit alpha, partial [Candidatus Aenigmarchaeota archaeon]|nr:pyruvate dehydrogenase (acetyl-transferring) E1 component subunit alpha [Candidatus Aenigmarchaeota archaeon]